MDFPNPRTAPDQFRLAENEGWDWGRPRQPPRFPSVSAPNWRTSPPPSAIRPPRIASAPALRVTRPAATAQSAHTTGQIALPASQTGQHALQGRPGGYLWPARGLGGAHGLNGRPESATRTCLRLRSSTAVTVAVQRCPFFACTAMRAPTSSAGSLDVSPR